LASGFEGIKVNNLFIDVMEWNWGNWIWFFYSICLFSSWLIWSTHHDRPIYSLKFLLQDGWKKFAWRLCTGNGEEEGGIEMARKSAKNFTFA
jgi:hypothetical protein